MTVLGGSSPARKSAAPSSCAPNRVDRFRLTGPSPQLDLRIHAARRDVADVALAAQVFAPHYARPLTHGCLTPRTAIRAAPAIDAVAVSELLLGERFALVDASGDWGWGYGLHDGYVGYVRCDALGPWIEPTHIVSAPAALVFAAPDIKSAVRARLPMGARIAGEVDGSGFVRATAGYLHPRHLTALAETAADPVAIAERLIGTPYLWGGRSGDGIDCSGLVQLALGFCGIAAPRDSDQQRALGAEIAADAPLRRGDLVFLPGHVGLMGDAATLVHANAHWMATVREPLADVIARQPADAGIFTGRPAEAGILTGRPADGGILARRRLAW